MRHVIIYAHPNPKSFCHAILETFKSTLESFKHEVVVRDLYAQNFNPVLTAADFVALNSGRVPADIKAEQDHIRRADVITFIYPVWWTGFPALIKGYIDRVFSNGFAFSYGPDGPRGLLTDKKAVVFSTLGASWQVYKSNGMGASMKKTLEDGIFEFCGIQVLEHKFFGSVPGTTDDVRKGYLEEVKKAGECLAC